jgi:hypothetical protein
MLYSTLKTDTISKHNEPDAKSRKPFEGAVA